MLRLVCIGEAYWAQRIVPLNKGLLSNEYCEAVNMGRDLSKEQEGICEGPIRFALEVRRT